MTVRFRGRWSLWFFPFFYFVDDVTRWLFLASGFKYFFFKPSRCCEPELLLFWRNQLEAQIRAFCLQSGTKCSYSNDLTLTSNLIWLKWREMTWKWCFMRFLQSLIFTLSWPSACLLLKCSLEVGVEFSALIHSFFKWECVKWNPQRITNKSTIPISCMQYSNIF